MNLCKHGIRLAGRCTICGDFDPAAVTADEQAVLARAHTTADVLAHTAAFLDERDENRRHRQARHEAVTRILEAGDQLEAMLAQAQGVQRRRIDKMNEARVDGGADAIIRAWLKPYVAPLAENGWSDERIASYLTEKIGSKLMQFCKAEFPEEPRRQRSVVTRKVVRTILREHAG